MNLIWRWNSKKWRINFIWNLLPSKCIWLPVFCFYEQRLSFTFLHSTLKSNWELKWLNWSEATLQSPVGSNFPPKILSWLQFNPDFSRFFPYKSGKVKDAWPDCVLCPQEASVRSAQTPWNWSMTPWMNRRTWSAPCWSSLPTWSPLTKTKVQSASL